MRPPKLVQYPGLKEEYYLSDFEPDRSLLDRFGVDPARVLVVLRPPPDVSLYHRHSNPLFPMTLEHLGRLEDVHAFVLPRTEEQREYVRKLDLPSVILPEDAVDAQSLIALADLVVSAGGTMNREAAALGVPVYTTYGGRLGGVDEELIREGRLKPLTDPRALDLRKRDQPENAGVRRDPALMLELLLSALPELGDVGERGEQLAAVALELRRPDARHLRELRDRPRRHADQLGERRSLKTTYAGTSSARARASRHSFSASTAGVASSFCFGVRARRRDSAPGPDAHLLEEPARLARPRDEQVPLRARHADVEQAPLVGELVAARATRRQLALFEPRQEDRLELEPFRAVQRQQMDAAARARAEALLQARHELRRRALAVVELLRKPDEPREVGLPRLLALAELLGRALQRARASVAIARTVAATSVEPPSPSALSSLPRRVAREQRRALERDAGVVERLLEVGRARVRPHEHGLLLERHARLRAARARARSRACPAPRASCSGAAPAPGRRRASDAASSRSRRASGRAGSRARAPAASSGSSARAARRAPAGNAAAAPSSHCALAPVKP